MGMCPAGEVGRDVFGNVGCLMMFILCFIVFYSYAFGCLWLFVFTELYTCFLMFLFTVCFGFMCHLHICSLISMSSECIGTTSEDMKFFEDTQKLLCSALVG